MGEIEIWKDLPCELLLSKYEVSNLGRLRNKVSQRVFKTNPSIDGYVIVDVSDDQYIARTWRLHRLICFTFHGNPENPQYTVDHINGIRDDNRAENLRWCSYEQQNTNRKQRLSSGRNREIYQYTSDDVLIRRWSSAREARIGTGSPLSNIKAQCTKKGYCNSGGFIWRYCEDVDHIDEIWRPIPNGLFDDEVFASDKGNIKVKDRVYKGKLDSHGYLRIYLMKDGQNKATFAHRIVCLAFHGYPPNGKPFVNHKDRNRSNNLPENLEWVSMQENIEHACGKIIIQFDLKGNELCRYPSVEKAASVTNLYASNIARVARGDRKTCGGFIWKYVA